MLLRVLKVFLSRAIASSGFLLIAMVSARNMDGYDNGVFIFNLSVVLGACVFARYGRDNALLRFGAVAKSNEKHEDFKLLLYYALRKTIWVSVPIMMFSVFIPILAFGEDVIKSAQFYVLVAIPLISILQIYSSAAKSYGLPEFGALVEAGSVCFFVSWCYFFARYFYAPSSVMPIIFILVSLLLIFICHNKFRSVGNKSKEVDCVYSQRHLLKKFSGASLPLFLMAVSYYFLQWGVNVFVGFFGGPAELTGFNIANRMSSLIPVALLVINTLVAPRMASLYESGRREDLEGLVRKVNLATFILGMPIIFILVFFADIVVPALFGSGYDSAASMLVILAIGQVFNLMAGPSMFCLAMTGYEKDLRNIYVSVSILTLILISVLAPMYGGLGVAFLVSGSMAFINIATSFFVRYRLKINTLLMDVFLCVKILKFM